jgi:sulfur-carrier protein
MSNNLQTIRIPVPFLDFTNGEEIVRVNAENVGTAVAELWSRFPDLKNRMTDDNGWLRRFVNVYVNNEDIRFLKNRETPLADGDQIVIIPDLIPQNSAVAAIAVANHLRSKNRL